VHEYAAAPAFNETVSVLTRPAGTLARALTTKMQLGVRFDSRSGRRRPLQQSRAVIRRMRLA
jgi:hypothetical protein